MRPLAWPTRIGPQAKWAKANYLNVSNLGRRGNQKTDLKR
jgi:hypothetical protein